MTTAPTESRNMAAILPWLIAYFFDIGHPFYGQLALVKARYPLTCITRPYRWLKFRALEVVC